MDGRVDLTEDQVMSDIAAVLVDMTRMEPLSLALESRYGWSAHPVLS